MQQTKILWITIKIQHSQVNNFKKYVYIIPFYFFTTKEYEKNLENIL